MARSLAAFFWGFVIASTALAAEDIAQAFTRLSAATAKGVNYQDYLDLVVEANIELKRYVASPSGKAHPEVVEAFGAALARYATALQIWQRKYDDPIKYFAGMEHSSDIELDSPLGKQLAKDYPGITKPASEGGAVVSPADRLGDRLSIDYVLRFVWRDARALTTQAVGKL